MGLKMPYFYHVTSVYSLYRISRCGITPNHAKGKKPWTWVVREGMVTPAVFHVKERDGLTDHEIVIIRIDARGVTPFRTMKRHYLATDKIISPVWCYWSRWIRPGLLKPLWKFRRSTATVTL